MRHLRRLVAGLTAAGLGLGLAVAASPAADAATPAPRPIVSGWLPYWTDASSLASVVDNQDLFDDVSPFWYMATGNSPSITISAHATSLSKASMTSTLRAQGIKVLPSITDGSGRLDMSAQLSTASGRARMVSLITNLVVANGYDGIDLDWEGWAFNSADRAIWDTTRVRWVAFIKSLSASLHAQRKLLSVTAPAGTATSSDSTGYRVYAWSLIGPYVDRLRIMAYDYSFSVAGPIAPYPWVDRVLAQAVTQVGSRKIQIGVPAYGRDWMTDVTGRCPNVAPDPATASTFLSKLAWARTKHEFSARGATSYVNKLFVSEAASVEGITRLTTPVSTWDSTQKERTFSYRLGFSGSYQAPAVKVVAVGGYAGGTNVIVASSAGVSIGDTVVGTGIRTDAAVKVTAVSEHVLTLGTANAGNVTGTLTVTNPTTKVARKVAAVGGVAGSTTVRVGSVSGVVAGASVTGAGIAVGPAARVTTAGGHTVALDRANTGSVTATVTTTPQPVASTCTIDRTGWYGEAGAAQAAALLVAKYQIAGIAQWALGGEDQDQWEPLRTYAASIAQKPTAVSLSAPTSMYAGRRASLGVYVSSEGAPVAGAAVAFLWRPAGGTTWTTAVRGVTGADGRVTVSSPIATVSGTWRARAADTWVRSAGDDVAAPTTVVKAPTALSLSVTARVAAGRTATATAKVTSLGAVVPGTPVTFSWRPSTSSTWTVLGRVLTDAAGVARKGYVPRTSGFWKIAVPATTYRLAASTPGTASTTLVPVVRAATTSISVAKGTSAALRATTAPAGAGQVVTVQRRTSTGWAKVVDLTTDSYGRMAWRLPTSTRGTFVYRWYVHATATHAAGFSAAVTVKVT